jgi:acetyl/propionyl-CoA carboxylase alpha subunit
MFRSLLVANRGEIALRVMRTARAMGLRVIAVYSRLIVTLATLARPTLQFASAVRPARIVPEHRIDRRGSEEICAEAIHPGYGFLAESAPFAQAVLDAGLTWIGPPPAAIRAMADKGAAKRLVRDSAVPVLATYAKETSSSIR